MTEARRTYLIVHAADWLALAVVGVLAVRLLGVAWWVPVVLIGAWITKDLLMYGTMRRCYEPQPAQRRIVGECGEALSRIDPHGLARVHGEIWRVCTVTGATSIDRGESIRVHDIEGLKLIVDRASEPI